ncbi:MAG: response regulator [Polyangiales bacterium]
MNEPSGLGWYALVADDDEDWRTLVSISLRRAGFQVCEACDGEELIHRFASLSALMSTHIVVVSDITMPGRDGVSATQQVRNASIDVPIILVTGERAPRILAAARDAGATLIMSKPIGCAELVEAVAALCA